MDMTADDENIELIRQFNDAVNSRDVDGMMRRMSEDCVFENTFPAPDGTRYAGQAAVRAFWVSFFTGSREARFEIADIYGHAGRYTMLWTYHWVGHDGAPGHIRGVDVYRVVNRRISEKLSYVKG